MSIDNLTPRAQQVLQLAAKAAKTLNHSYVGTEHLLIGLIDLGQGGALAALRAHADPAVIRKTVLGEVAGLYRPGDGAVTVAVPIEPVAAASEPRKHYILFDESVQWFAAVATLGKRTVWENGRVWYEHELFHDIPPPMWNHPFISNLTAREPAFTNTNVKDNTWTGWSVSEAEADRVRKLVSLRSQVDEYNRLASYP